jgi:hypothetical protein
MVPSGRSAAAEAIRDPAERKHPGKLSGLRRGHPREALAGALGPHQQHTPRQGQAVAARLLAEGPVALLQPVLERLQTADIGRAGLAGAVLQQLAAGDRLPFLLQHLGQIRLPQLAPLG